MLHGERVSLRPIRADDLPVMREWFRDREIASTWARHPVVPDNRFNSDLDDKFQTFDLHGHFSVENEQGQLIGRIDFEDLERVDRTVEISIVLGASEGRGKGYGTDAFHTLIEHLFVDRQIERVWLTVIAGNDPAIRMYERFGFIHEGRLEQTIWLNGEWHDLLLMGLMKNEYAGRP